MTRRCSNQSASEAVEVNVTDRKQILRKIVQSVRLLLDLHQDLANADLVVGKLVLRQISDGCQLVELALAEKASFQDEFFDFGEEPRAEDSLESLLAQCSAFFCRCEQIVEGSNEKLPVAAIMVRATTFGLILLDHIESLDQNSN